MTRWWISGLAVLAFATGVDAQGGSSGKIQNAGDFVRTCEAPVSDDAATICAYYIEGMGMMLAVMQKADLLKAKVICLPAGTGTLDWYWALIRFVKSDPSAASNITAAALLRSLAQAYPCKDG